MLEQELKHIWNNSSQKERISINTSQLVEELNAKVNKIRAMVKKRDMREISASIIGILIFMFLFYEIPFPITKLACTMSILWFAFVIFKFKKSKAKNIASHFDLSVKEELSHHKDAMKHQAALLDSTAYWYAIPPFIINCVFLLGLGNPADYNWTNGLAESILPLSINMKIATILGLAIFYGFVIWINKRAANKVFRPILKNINRIEAQMET